LAIFCPNHEPEKFGIKEKFPQNYFGQMLYPIFPGKLNTKIDNLINKKQDLKTAKINLSKK